jgi:phospholipid/cholesterol/gamma-HCH transport system permease protein
MKLIAHQIKKYPVNALAWFTSVYSSIGRGSIYFCLVLKDIILFQFYRSVFFNNLFSCFLFSLPVVFLTSFFTGAVLTIQTYSGLGNFASVSSLANVISLSIIKELGPVITGLMISGKLASSLAAEIATMKTGDQINALKTLSINPRKFITSPTVLAVVCTMPFLLIFSDLIGFLGSFTVVKFKILSIPTTIYITTVINYIAIRDILISILKVLVFGLCISFCACYVGINSKEGSMGVGFATTNSVVISSILILITNYIITSMFF